MNDAMLSLKDDLVSEVDAYVTGSLQRWIIYEVRARIEPTRRCVTIHCGCSLTVHVYYS